MIDAEKFKYTLQVLRALNGAVTASRMYPPMSPQVMTALERAKNSIDDYLQQESCFYFGVIGDDQEVGGEKLDAETRSLLSDIALFKQLEVLQLPYLVIEKEISMTCLKQIIQVMISRKEKISREGGGRSFVTHLELDEYFPDEYTPVLAASETVSSESSEELISVAGKQAVKPEMIRLVLRPETQELSADLKEQLADVSFAQAFLLHGLKEVFLSFNEKEGNVFFEEFEELIAKMEANCPEELKKELLLFCTEELPNYVADSLYPFFLVQGFHSEFGQRVFAAILAGVRFDQFKKALVSLRSLEAKLLKEDQLDEEKIERVRTVHRQLLATPFGQQLLGIEHAQEDLKRGEEERKADRVATGIQKILQGDTSPFMQDEIVFSLPKELTAMFEEGKLDEVKAISSHMMQAFEDKDTQMRTRLSQCLCVVGDVVQKDGRKEILDWFVPLALSAFQKAENGDFVLETLTQHLQIAANSYLRGGERDKAQKILALFYGIRKGSIKKSPPVRALVGRVQEKQVRQSLLATLLKEYLEEKNKQSGLLLLAHGPAGLMFVLEVLVDSRETADRLRLLELLLSAKEMLPPVLVKALANPMPWYGKRNLLKLLGETGSQEYGHHAVDFLHHADLRVQREAYLCLYKIGGGNRKNLLLKGAGIAGDGVLPQIVKGLTAFDYDKQIGKALLEILVRYKSFSEVSREKIIEPILNVFVQNPEPKALQIVASIREKEGGENGLLGKYILSRMDDFLGQKKEALQQDKAVSPNTSVQKKSLTEGRQNIVEKKPVASITYLPEENVIRDMLNKGAKDEAKNKLLSLISDLAKQRKFDHAEALREWLIELDPQGLSDIIQTAEIIEEEKTLAIDKEHIVVWKDLYEILTTEEFSTLYHAMQHRIYKSSEIVVEQGDMLSALFFINSGIVKLFYKEGGADVLIKTLDEGEVLGVESFFDTSVWTVSAVAMGRADIAMLRIDRLQKWRDDFPALESKLNDYCLKFSSLHEYLKIGRKDRRKYQRVAVNGRVSSVFLDKKGQPTKVGSKGDLADISQGGASFFIRISKRENARILLGRNVRLHLPAVETKGKMIAVDGTIVAIKAHLAMENEYSIHVKLHAELAKNDMQKVCRAAKTD